jgi:hypothetical protein
MYLSIVAVLGVLYMATRDVTIIIAIAVGLFSVVLYDIIREIKERKGKLK